ncbi:hypothetical protein OnM2_060021 [Erysiphe neolycopersici]|uniref:Uncharacterized protein n=1 Tax=Erysiphe neolycopersici TaxID=212602 RepID=A0A420HPT0_9PEZI|nr:hypothetical protein OnM2_060021 [Erysiphe neolycopersici]
MQIDSNEMLKLKARNDSLTKNISELENKNEKLKSENSSLSIVIENQRTDLISLDEIYVKLLNDFEEIKHEKKDSDEKVLNLKKQVKSEKSELERAYNELKTQTKNEQSVKACAKRLSELQNELNKKETNNKNLTNQLQDCEIQLDQTRKKCETLRRHNVTLSYAAKKIQLKYQSPSSSNNINETFSEDKGDEPPNELEETLGPQLSLAPFQSIQESCDEMMNKDSCYRKISLNEGPLLEKEKWEEIENSTTNPGNFLDSPELFWNSSLNSQLCCYERIGNAGSVEQKPVVEALRSATHNLVCRWIDVEINFFQVSLEFIIEAFILIRAFLIRYPRQHQYQKWKVFGSLNLPSCVSYLFSTSLWISLLLINTLLKPHMIYNGIGNYGAGHEFQCNYEPINSDEPASDQEISSISRRSSISSMAEEDINNLKSPQCHSPKKSDSGSSFYLPYQDELLPPLDKPLSLPSLSPPDSSSYEHETYKIGRLHGLQKSNPELAPISEPLEGELSRTESMLRIISLLFFAPVGTGAINKRSIRSSNSNLSLLPTCNSSSLQDVFSIPSKFIKIFSNLSADSAYGTPPIWLTMIEMFIHICVYAFIKSVWLKGLQSSFPHSSYYVPTNGYGHLHGWAHQLHFSEQWASKLERFTFNIITLFGVQVKNFPIPG